MSEAKDPKTSYLAIEDRAFYFVDLAGVLEEDITSYLGIRAATEGFMLSQPGLLEDGDTIVIDRIGQVTVMFVGSLEKYLGMKDRVPAVIADVASGDPPVFITVDTSSGSEEYWAYPGIDSFSLLLYVMQQALDELTPDLLRNIRLMQDVSPLPKAKKLGSAPLTLDLIDSMLDLAEAGVTHCPNCEDPDCVVTALLRMGRAGIDRGLRIAAAMHNGTQQVANVTVQEAAPAPTRDSGVPI